MQGSGQEKEQSTMQGSGQRKAQATMQGSGQGSAQATMQGSGQEKAQASVGGSEQGIAQTPVQDIIQGIEQKLIAKVQIQSEINEIEKELKILKPRSEQERAQAPVQANGQGKVYSKQDIERELPQNKIEQEEKQIEVNELQKQLKTLQQSNEQKRALASVQANEQTSMRAQTPPQDSEKGRARIQTQDSGWVIPQASTPDNGQARAQTQTQVGNVLMSTEVREEDRSSCKGLWNFTCLLFNLGRNNKQITSSSHDETTTDPAGKRTYTNTSEERKKLLQPVFDKQPDAIFLQETDRHRTVLSTLESDYHVNDNKKCGVAVLLKASTFETDDITSSILEILTDSQIKSLYTKMVDDDEMKMCFCKAAPLDRRNDSILMASYHGRKYFGSNPQKQISTEKHCEIYTNLLKICQHLQDQTGARHMLIAGDFNTSFIVFDQALRDAETTLTTQTQTKKTQRRDHKDVIDYFVISRHIARESVKALSFQSDIEEVDYRQLDCYFDHDPIFAEFSL